MKKVKKKTLRSMNRALAFLMSAVIAVTALGLDSLIVNAAGTTNPTELKPGLDVTPASVLGEAINYGLVANDITFHGHFETNFATKILHTDTSNEANGPKVDGFVGNIVIADYQDMQVGSGLMYDPNNAAGKINTGIGTIYTTLDSASKFSTNRVVSDGNGGYKHTSPTPTSSLQFDLSHSKEELSDYVESMVNYAATKSAELNTESNSKGINYSDIVETSTGIKVIDIAKYNTEEGTYYINFSSEDWDDFREGDGGRFRLSSGQKVVLNISGTDITLSKFFIVHAEDGSQYNSDGDKAEMAERFIFNFPNATKITIEGSVDGTFLAPYATVDQRIVAGGWLVADKYSKVKGQEWHLNNPLKSNTPPFANEDDTFVNITFTKTSSIGASADGAKFALYYDSECTNPVELGETVSKLGNVTFTGIKYDAKNGTTYYLKEIEPLKDHVLDINTYMVVIAADGTYKLTNLNGGEISNKTLVNKPADGSTTIQFTKVNENISSPSPLAGATFALYSDSDCNTMVGTAITTGADGKVSFAGVSYSKETVTTYYIKETNAPDGYQTFPNTIKVTIDTSGKVAFDSSINNGNLSNSLLTTTISFTKIDKKDNSGLNGAEFTVYSDKDCSAICGTATSQNGGIVEFKNVKYSQNSATTYYIKETKAPDGYMAISDVITVTIDTNGNVSLSNPVDRNKQIANEKVVNPTTISFTKVDENGNALQGAEFTIYSDAACASFVGVATSDSNGVVTFSNISYKKNADTLYYIKETKAPDGYELLEDVITVTIDKKNITSFSSTVVDGKVTNKPLVKKEFIFIKVNEKGEALSGATFTLSGSNGYSATVTTDATGIVSFENIPYSLNDDTEYILTETTAPAGYKVVANKTITIDINGDIKSLAGFKVINNTTPQLVDEENMGDSARVSFTKVNLYNKEAVSGATFELYNEAGYKIGKAVVSGEDGKVVFDKLTYSTIPNTTTKYTIKETTAPEGYVKSEAVINVSVDNKGTVTISGANVNGNRVTNTPVTGTLKITKTIKGDLTAEEIAGDLVFVVKNNTTNVETSYTVGNDFTKNTNGVYELVLSDVETGSYTVTETVKDKDGYALTVKYAVNSETETEGNKAEVTVIADKESMIAYTNVYTKEVVTPKTGNLKITKTIQGDLTAEEIAGDLVFVVKNNTTNVETSYTVGTDFTKNADGVYELVLSDVETGSYTVTETVKDKDGYALTVKYAVNGGAEKEGNSTEVTVTASNEVVVDYTNEYSKFYTADVTFSKRAIMGGSELVGAEITLEMTDVKSYDSEKVVSTSGHTIAKDKGTISWISTDKPLVLSGLPDGTYVMTESAAPSGYEIATVIEFKLEKGKVSRTANTSDKIETSAIVAEPHNIITMIDDATTMVSFDKKSISLAGDSLAGAKLQIHNADGVTKLTNVYTTNGDSLLSDDELYLSWTSTGNGTTPIQFWGLPNGLYVLEETEAPTSTEYIYHKADPIAFKVNNGIITYESTERKEDGSKIYYEPDNWILLVDLGDPIPSEDKPDEGPKKNEPPKSTPKSDTPKTTTPSDTPKSNPPKDTPKNEPVKNEPPKNTPQVPPTETPKTPAKKATVTINDNKTPLAGNVTMAGDVNTGNLTGDEFANEGLVYAVLSLIAALSLIGAALLGRKKED